MNAAAAFVSQGIGAGLPNAPFASPTVYQPGPYGGQMPAQMPGTMLGQMQAGFQGMEAQPMVALLADAGNAMLPGERLQSIDVTSKVGGNMSGANALNQMASAGATDVSTRMLNNTGSNTIATVINVVGGLFAKKAANTTYIWALRGKLSVNRIPSHLPRFEVSFADIPGVDPDLFEPHIVRLESTKDNWRLLGATIATQSSNNAAPGVTYSSFLEHDIETQKESTNSGHVQVVPTKDLAPGEYAVVLRPVSAKKKLSSDAVSRNDGEGLLFNLAWSFSVN
jgi:hypothetical protein